MIEIALDSYADIFNEWDPAPFKRRDLDPDLQLYLVESSSEIPRKYAIELCFRLPVGKRDQSMETESQNGLKYSLRSQRYFLNQAISGWVFLWEAVSLFVFTNRDLYQRYQTYQRLQEAPVFF